VVELVNSLNTRRNQPVEMVPTVRVGTGSSPKLCSNLTQGVAFFWSFHYKKYG